MRISVLAISEEILDFSTFLTSFLLYSFLDSERASIAFVINFMNISFEIDFYKIGFR